jgi:hypothetical protein
VLKVHPNGIFDHSPFGAVFVLCDGMKAGKRSGTHREQPAGVVPDTLGFALLAEAFWRTTAALCRLFHVENYDITKLLICDITNAILYS